MSRTSANKQTENQDPRPVVLTVGPWPNSGGIRVVEMDVAGHRAGEVQTAGITRPSIEQVAVQLGGTHELGS